MLHGSYNPLLQGTSPAPDVEFLYRSDSEVAEWAFSMSNTTLTHYGFPLTVTGDDKFDLKSLVFATASTSDRFHVALDSIAKVQRIFPHNIIYFYDLDATPSPDIAHKVL